MITIGQLAKQTDSKVETIRYYERSGLMPAPARSSGGYRLYEQTHTKRLNFIRRCRELGFPIERIRELLAISEDSAKHTRAEVKSLAEDHLKTISEKIRDLEKLKTALNHMASHCDGAHATAEQCPILNALFER